MAFFLSGFSRRAFSLTELLVVIAIIGILVAMLLPAIKSMQKSSWQTACGFNMGKCAQAGLLFSKENQRKTVPLYIGKSYGTNGFFALAAPQVITSHSGVISWEDILFPYLETKNSFSCPQLKVPATIGYGGVFSNTDKLGIGININKTGFYSAGYPPPIILNSMFRVDNSSQQVFFADAAGVSSVVPFTSRFELPGGAGGYFGFGGGGGSSNFVMPRHRGRVNFGFFDGHVAILNPALINYKENVVPAGFVGSL